MQPDFSTWTRVVARLCSGRFVQPDFCAWNRVVARPCSDRGGPCNQSGCTTMLGGAVQPDFCACIRVVARPCSGESRAIRFLCRDQSGCITMFRGGPCNHSGPWQKSGCTVLPRVWSCNHSGPCTKIWLHSPSPEHGHATTLHDRLAYAPKSGCTALSRAWSCNHAGPCT